MTVEEFKSKHEINRKEQAELEKAYSEAQAAYREKLREEKELKRELAESLLGVKVGDNALFKTRQSGEPDGTAIVNIEELEASVYNWNTEKDHISIMVRGHRLKKDGTPSRSNADLVQTTLGYGNSTIPKPGWYTQYIFVCKAE